MEIDYSKYSVKSLLEALGNIDAEAYPENYENLTREIALRKNEVQAFYAQAANAKKAKWSRLLKFISINQFFVATIALVTLVLSLSALAWIEITGSVLVFALNALSGIILYKRIEKYYLLPYINIGLQIFSFGLGGLYFNYYGVGGIFLTVDWVSDTHRWLSASFNLGGALFDFSNEYQLGFIQIDLLAIFYLWAIEKSLSQSCN